MPPITQIGKYAILNTFPARQDNLSFAVLDKEKQTEFFCKVVTGLQPSEGAQQTFKDTARKLARLNSAQINAKIDSGYGKELGQFFIVYPMLHPDQTLKQAIPVNAFNNTHS